MIRLKSIEDVDHEFLVELHNDPVVLKNLTHPEPITLEHHLTWWNSVKDNACQARFVICNDNAKIGLAKFYDIDRTNRSCALGADLHRDFRGLRLARPVWREMLRTAFIAFDLHRVWLTTAEYNDVARYVYTTLGFKTEGRFERSLLREGVFYDQIIMRLFREEWSQGE